MINGQRLTGRAICSPNRPICEQNIEHILPRDGLTIESRVSRSLKVPSINSPRTEELTVNYRRSSQNFPLSRKGLPISHFHQAEPICSLQLRSTTRITVLCHAKCISQRHSTRTLTTRNTTTPYRLSSPMRWVSGVKAYIHKR